ncbi:hypothetical protein GOODEAATRI_027098 [Goodea atripinnis]|uniref:Uncharacterized protein n=1 Tax=Goodea atripinnis TaxID=208336 RepID=A0ABV0PHE3_9TELE
MEGKAMDKQEKEGHRKRMTQGRKDTGMDKRKRHKKQRKKTRGSQKMKEGSKGTKGEVKRSEGHKDEREERYTHCFKPAAKSVILRCVCVCGGGTKCLSRRLLPVNCCHL